jgi:spore germination protein KC
MGRRLLRLLALALLPALLSGGWSYRSRSDLSIVMGLGIDRAPDGHFKICAEIVDLTKTIKESGPGARLVEAEGQTIFDAVREAKRKLLNKLYFGNMQIVVIGEEAARTVGIENAVDWIMRDAECRETVSLVIMEGGTAFDLMTLDGLDQSILSLEIDDIITDDNRSTATTVHADLYQVFGTLNCPGIELTLPAFHIAVNDGAAVAESNGIAVFRDDRLADFLTPRESKFFLIAIGKAQGGILTVAKDGGERPDTSLEIANSRAEFSYDVADGGFAFHIRTETDVYLAETMETIDAGDPAEMRALEDEAARSLEAEIAAVIQKIQRQTGQDILGLGEYLHRRDYRLWHEVEGRWGEIFRDMPITVSCRVNIKNTAFITSEGAIKS